MEVIRQDVDALNADLVVKVANNDYAEKFNATLKDYAKKVNLPGFRNGKVPFPVVKKRFGKSILAEEMNTLLSEALQNYITENKLNILGNPMPKEDVDVKGDWENPGDFEFAYSIGLSPELEVKLNKRTKQEYYTIKVDDNILKDEVENLQRRYGSLTNVDKVGANDLVLGQFVELNEDGSIKEGGIMNSSTISVEFLDAAAKKAIKGKKVEDTIVIDPRNYSKDDNDLATMLGIAPEAIATIGDKFNFTINEVKEMKKADIDEEFLMKATNDESIKTEADLKEWFKGNIAKSFAESSDELFIRQVSNGLVDKLNPELPEEFLKAWITASNPEGNMEHQIEHHWDDMKKGIQWEVIEGNLLTENDVKIEFEDIMNYTKTLIIQNYANYGIPAPEDKELQESAMKVLQNQDEFRRVSDKVKQEKLVTLFKEKLKLDEKEVSIEEFKEIASK